MKKFLHFLIISSIILQNFAMNKNKVNDGPSQKRRGKRPLETVNDENLPKSRRKKADAAEKSPEDFIPDFSSVNLTADEIESWLLMNSDGENDEETMEEGQSGPSNLGKQISALGEHSSIKIADGSSHGAHPIPQGHETATNINIPISVELLKKEKAKLLQEIKIRRHLLAMIDQALGKLRLENQQFERELNSIYAKLWPLEMTEPTLANEEKEMVKKLRAEKSAIMDRRMELNKKMEIMKAERCKVMDQISEKDAQIARLNVD